jgi:hypothetical protein
MKGFTHLAHVGIDQICQGLWFSVHFMTHLLQSYRSEASEDLTTFDGSGVVRSYLSLPQHMSREKPSAKLTELITS